MLTPQRPSLHQTVQQHAATALALIVGAQFAPLATASFTPDPELDEFPADTTSGSITATMKPGVACIAGKPYVFRKKAAANSYTIAFSGSETYEGASTIVLSDDDAVAAIMWDPVSAEWVRASAAGVGGDVPAGVAAIDGSNISGADLTAFKAKIAAVAKADTQSFGPFDLSLIGATADKMRFYPGFACTVTGVVSAQLKGTVATGAATTTLTTTAGSPTGNSITHAIGETVNQKKTMAPSGANCVVGATDFIELAITGTNDGANSKAGYTIQYTRT
ncbi:hypothetical protein [uncultured Zoogloea sp.]|uniref:hypothetical protein n=1 Tax=uncultured Zoogloea sp. TaxID=160237 RepID=UPI00262C1675|nr:hypothetical protein [uncultured Zoogloea sp.]